MTQIKIFEGHGNNEDEVNIWLKENKNINVISVMHQTIYDYYDCYTPPTICNQWIATTIVYTGE